jgi:hypothetical protein
MMKGLLIGAGVVIVGIVAYKVVKKKNPKFLATAKKKASDIGKRTSEIVTEAKRAFSEGFTSVQAKATA